MCGENVLAIYFYFIYNIIPYFRLAYIKEVVRKMKISPVSNQTNNITFGKFADKNARQVVKQALSTDDWVMKPVYDSWFKRIEDCDFFEAYTDEKDKNTVKGRFTDEFVKSNAGNRNITRDIDSLKRNGILNDLSIFDNADVVANSIPDFIDMLKGVNLSEKWRSKNPHGDAREEERAKEEFLNNLAD